jgi:hypothetical protein
MKDVGVIQNQSWMLLDVAVYSEQTTQREQHPSIFVQPHRTTCGYVDSKVIFKGRNPNK